ncbi:hypothetical protein N7535_004365 [Penicillium sp. DV-2018c]|nr:hypothetical protein N7461_007949 [Penicillium sp. DV-2018c]KAJ5570705.1 hypothetical protein N7535_004365 [Penicillium sp. DV-2018c]
MRYALVAPAILAVTALAIPISNHGDRSALDIASNGDDNKAAKILKRADEDLINNFGVAPNVAADKTVPILKRQSGSAQASNGEATASAGNGKASVYAHSQGDGWASAEASSEVSGKSSAKASANLGSGIGISGSLSSGTSGHSSGGSGGGSGGHPGVVA